MQTSGAFSEDAPILFLSSADIALKISNLLTIVDQTPHWIAVPNSPADGMEIQGNVVHPTGRVQCRDEEQKQLSFALYPLEARARKEARSIRPVKAKIPEPEQNLQQRGRWFQNRRKIR